MTLEKQYENYKKSNPYSNITFEEWEVMLSKKLEEDLNQINLDGLTTEKTKDDDRKITKFKIGDKLEALEFDKDLYGLEFVVVTSINEKNEIYHWEYDMPNMYGKIVSGYYFNEVKEYKETN